MHQPDFEALFFATFADLTGAVDYRVRTDSNFPHDLAFLRSLIRDATFVAGRVGFLDGVLLIPLRRLKWERQRDFPGSGLDSCDSTLELRGLEKVSWVGSQFSTVRDDGALLSDPSSVSESTACEIDRIEAEFNSEGLIEVRLRGYPHNWSLAATLCGESFHIQLSDA